MRRTPLGLMLGAGALALAVVLAALDVGRLRAGSGYEGAVRAVLDSEWWTLWSIPPVEVTLILVLGAWFLLGWRRWTPPVGVRGRWAVAGGLVVLLAAVCSPLGAFARSGVLAAHMGQHVLVGALAPLLLLFGLPRGRLVGHGRVGRTVARACHPAWAFGIWVASTIVWLLPDLHHEVLTREWVWVLQQVSMLLVGVLLWAPVIGRIAPGPAWFGTGVKCGYMVGVWFVGLMTANVMWFSGTPFYGDHAAVAAALGVSPLQDQANAGTVMMLAHCLISFVAIAVLFFRSASEEDGPAAGAGRATEPVGSEGVRAAR